MEHIGIIGAGAWGTALALSCARAGHAVSLWVREPELAETMRRRRENVRYLPDIALPEAIMPTNDLGEAAAGEVLLLVTPAQTTREMLRALKMVGAVDEKPLVLCAKGIEVATGEFLSDVVGEEAPAFTPFVLSGPSFAIEVAKNLPAAVTLAGEDIERARELARLLAHPRFRIYSSDDIIGVQLGGALKNVLAIACGIVAGMGLGDSARAALLTRAFAEMRRLGRALGAREETLSGLSGLGDLMLTATSAKSRNYTLGEELGRGRSLDEVMGERITVAEGVFTAQIVTRMAQEHGVDMPVSEAVRRVVTGQSKPVEEVEWLLSRPLRDETEPAG